MEKECNNGKSGENSVMCRQFFPQFQGLRAVAFAYHKIERLYLLHIVTMLCAALIRVYSILIGYEAYPKLLLDIVLHSTLTQIWIPNSLYYNTLNGVAWYLCAAAFAYFCFPIILKKLREVEIVGGIEMDCVSDYHTNPDIGGIIFYW